MSTEADKGNWDEDFKPRDESGDAEKSNDRIPYMTFDKPGEYRARLVGNYVRFLRWWAPFTSRVITHDSYRDEDPAWNVKGFWPRLTFAIHIIDRQDKDAQHPTGKLKILEKGTSIFEAFASYKRINDINPAGAEGPDFVITVEWPGGNKRQAKYKVTACAKPSPFSDQEKEMVKNEHAPLKEIYKATPLDKIKELWEELSDDAKIPPKRDDKEEVATTHSTKQSTRVTEPIEDPIDANTSDEEDLFGDDTTEF